MKTRLALLFSFLALAKGERRLRPGGSNKEEVSDGENQRQRHCELRPLQRKEATAVLDPCALSASAARLGGRQTMQYVQFTFSLIESCPYHPLPPQVSRSNRREGADDEGERAVVLLELLFDALALLGD